MLCCYGTENTKEYRHNMPENSDQPMMLPAPREPVQFTLTYSGSALDRNTMDAEDLASSLVAISNLCAHTRTAVTGSEDRRVSVHVRGFNAGSFNVTLEIMSEAMRSIGDNDLTAHSILMLIGLVGPPQLASTADGLIQFLKWKQNRKIQSTESTKSGVEITVEGSHNNVTVISNSTHNMFRNQQVRKSLSKMLEPLRRDGVDEMRVVSDSGEETVTIPGQEVDDGYYDAAADEVGLQDEVVMEPQVVSAVVEIYAPVFDRDGKWRFYYGQGKIWATIEDEEFTREVVDGKALRFGDKLHVKLEIRQQLKDDGSTVLMYRVLEVLRHTPGPAQLKFIED